MLKILLLCLLYSYTLLNSFNITKKMWCRTFLKAQNINKNHWFCLFSVYFKGLFLYYLNSILFQSYFSCWCVQWRSVTWDVTDRSEMSEWDVSILWCVTGVAHIKYSYSLTDDKLTVSFPAASFGGAESLNLPASSATERRDGASSWREQRRIKVNKYQQHWTAANLLFLLLLLLSLLELLLMYW